MAIYFSITEFLPKHHSSSLNPLYRTGDKEDLLRKFKRMEWEMVENNH